MGESEAMFEPNKDDDEKSAKRAEISKIIKYELGYELNESNIEHLHSWFQNTQDYSNNSNIEVFKDELEDYLENDLKINKTYRTAYFAADTSNLEHLIEILSQK